MNGIVLRISARDPSRAAIEAGVPAACDKLRCVSDSLKATVPTKATFQTPTTNNQTARNIRAIAAMEQEALQQRSALDRVSDAVTSAAATPWFVIIHLVWFGGWVGLNALVTSFDRYPFSLLTLLVSLEAIFLTGFVLMSQNRMTKQADKRAHLDLQVNLLAEQELTAMMGMLRSLCERADVPVASHDAPVDELLEKTDINQIAQAVDEELLRAGAGQPESAATDGAPAKK
jgi:uncharacterized membrane protein